VDADATSATILAFDGLALASDISRTDEDPMGNITDPVPVRPADPFGVQLVAIFRNYIMPFLLVGALFWAIWIGIQFGTAKDPGARDAAKQRLIKAIATVFIFVLLLGMLALLPNDIAPVTPPCPNITEDQPYCPNWGPYDRYNPPNPRPNPLPPPRCWCPRPLGG